jgi:hypothetical protein
MPCPATHMAKMDSTMLTNLLKSVAGGALGALVGYLAFRWLLAQGFYALALPGTGLGLGSGLASNGGSLRRSLLCGVLGVVIGIVAEWRTSPFISDESFTYFLTHLHELQPLTLLMIVAGGVFAAWFSRGREQATTK